MTRDDVCLGSQTVDGDVERQMNQVVPLAESATQKAYRTLERLIVTLELSPGSITTEGALIERVELGRTPVREAIQRLAWEGLLEVRARAGLAVAPLNPADWLKVIDARRGVEVLIARSAARVQMRDFVSKLHAAAQAMGKAGAAGNVVAFLEADKLLDETIAAASDNPFAARMAAPLQIHSRRFWFRFQSRSGLNEAVHHHVQLIGTIVDGDEDGAARAADRLFDLLRSHAQDCAPR